MKLIKFYKVPCVPCVMMENLLDFLEVEPDETYQKDERLDLEEKYGIMTVPSLVVVDEDGNLIDKFTGVINLEQFLIDKGIIEE